MAGKGSFGSLLSAPPRERLQIVDPDEVDDVDDVDPASSAPETPGPETPDAPEAAAGAVVEVGDDADVASQESPAEKKSTEKPAGKRGSGGGAGRRKSAPTAEPGTAVASSPAETKPVKKDKGGARVPLRLDQDLRDLLWKAAKQRDCSLAEVVFDAVEAAAASERLGDIVAEHMPETVVPATGPNALFSRPVTRRAQPKVTIELRMTSSDRKVLDLLVKQHKADSRSQLIIAALKDHLE